MVTVILSILGVLATTALSIGLQHVADRVERDKANSGDTNPAYLLGTLQYALDSIRQRSNQAYTQVMDRINAMPQLAAAGGLASYMRQARQELSQKAAKASDIANQVEDAVSGFKNEVSTFSYMPDTYKNSDAGKAHLNQLKEKATTLQQNIETKLGDN